MYTVINTYIHIHINSYTHTCPCPMSHTQARSSLRLAARESAQLCYVVYLTRTHHSSRECPCTLYTCIQVKKNLKRNQRYTNEYSAPEVVESRLRGTLFVLDWSASSGLDPCSPLDCNFAFKSETSL